MDSWVVALAIGASALSGATAVGEAARGAYIDPGAGSLLVQALLAALAGAVVAVHSYWKRIKAFLGRAEPEEPDPEETHVDRADG